MKRVRLDEIEMLPALGGELQWKPVRYALGVSAFGINAYVGASVGDLVVEEHADDHQELYLVAAGCARFRCGDEEFDAPEGTLVLLEPGEHRLAHATEAGTTVVAIGADAERFTPSAWELGFRVSGLVALGRLDEARAAVDEALATHPDWGFHFCRAQLAAAEGKVDVARAHLAEAAEADATVVARARADRLLAPLLRESERVPDLPGT
jgi:mannose-6-phosphate isomerase-like protein (cupin superfamily)